MRLCKRKYRKWSKKVKLWAAFINSAGRISYLDKQPEGSKSAEKLRAAIPKMRAAVDTKNFPERTAAAVS